MQRRISSTHLYHYTAKESLLGILNEGFRFGSASEYLHISDPEAKDIYLAIPGIVNYRFTWRIVSFCDIPLDLVEDHRSQYGDYAIGLTKEWAIRNRISPVRYVHHNTPVNLKLFNEATTYLNLFDSDEPLKAVIDILNLYRKETPILLGNISQDAADVAENLISLCRRLIMMSYQSGAYLRYYKDNWTDRGGDRKHRERSFYDEKEWRIVSFAQNPKNLTFDYDDIAHIIVKAETDKPAFEKALFALASLQESRSDKMVQSKVLSFAETMVSP